MLFSIGLNQIERRCSGKKEAAVRTAIALDEEVGSSAKQIGRVTRKRGSKKLYVDFFYNGARIEKSTGLDDTPKNWQVARQWIEKQTEKIANGNFRFAEAFPGASEKEKAFHAAREGWEFKSEPLDVKFGDYVASWLERIWAKYPSEVKRHDYKQVIDDWLLLHFGDKSFQWITGVRLQEFVSGLKWRKGKNAGKQLSPSRIRNILIPLRTIWMDACEEHGWDMKDPFKFVSRHIPKVRKKQREVFRFDEWRKVIDAMDPFFKFHAEFMIMTGIIASEMAGLRKNDISAGYITIQNSIVRGHEKETLKTEYRFRCIPITAEIRKRLDVVMTRTAGKYVFTMKSGIPFSESSFRNNVWIPAFKKAGVEYKVPYTTRHTFTAWCSIIGKSKDKVVRLMGHGSKEMVDRVYGHYREGLEEDAISILEYFGPDFVEEERKLAAKLLTLRCESFAKVSNLASLSA